MTSRPVFSYPAPHSTFIPISYDTVTASGQTRKRKRTKSLATNSGDGDAQDDDDDDDNHDDENLQPATEDVSIVPATSWTPVNPLPTESSLKSEGLDCFDTPFYERPKTLARNPEHRARNAGYDEDIADALPPMQPMSLHAKHISNVSTILHVCILRRDWKRAKRAFRLLLLSDEEKDAKNLRLKRIWKLGVEVLSWEQVTSEQGQDGNEVSPPRRDYSKAVEYMSRLVNLYPYYKHYVVGKGVNATTIHPILMHFEILALHESLSNVGDGEHVAAAKKVISGIESLAEKLKTLQETPPWVDMIDLWKLRGQLQLWAADLSDKHLKDQESSLKFKRLAKGLARKMKERGIDGWEEFTSQEQFGPDTHELSDTP